MSRPRTPVAGSPADSTPLDTAPPAGPDAKLLRLCDEVLDVIAEDEALDREMRALPSPCVDQPRWPQIIKAQKDCAARRRALLSLVTRETATTAAGLYAKAQVLRRTDGKQPGLALSLATELLGSAELRRAIWPAEGVML